jgi:hypothetical protein
MKEITTTKDFIIEKKGALAFAYAPALRQVGIRHAFTLRLGGKSIINPGSLNLSLHVDDEEKYILQNR